MRSCSATVPPTSGHGVALNPCPTTLFAAAVKVCQRYTLAPSKLEVSGVSADNAASGGQGQGKERRWRREQYSREGTHKAGSRQVDQYRNEGGTGPWVSGQAT